MMMVDGFSLISFLVLVFGAGGGGFIYPFSVISFSGRGNGDSYIHLYVSTYLSCVRTIVGPSSCNKGWDACCYEDSIPRSCR